MNHLVTSCLGKVAFKSKADAAKALRYGRNGGALQVYRCPACRLFHLGHVKPRKRRP